MLEKTHGIVIDVDKIDYDDKKVLASIGTGKTDGVFQLESPGMKNFMKELQARRIWKMSLPVFPCIDRVLWTLFRSYIKGKNNPGSGNV